MAARMTDSGGRSPDWLCVPYSWVTGRETGAVSMVESASWRVHSSLALRSISLFDSLDSASESAACLQIQP